MAHRAALISISLALSQTPVELTWVADDTPEIFYLSADGWSPIQVLTEPGVH